MRTRIISQWSIGLSSLVLGVGLSFASTANQNPLKEGDLLRSQGNYEAAQAAYSEAAKSTGLPAAYRRLAGMQMVQHDYRGSIDNFQKAIGLDPDNAEAFIGLAMSYVHTQNYTLARAALQEALQRKPEAKAEISKVMEWLQQRSAPAMTAQNSIELPYKSLGHHPVSTQEGK